MNTHREKERLFKEKKGIFPGDGGGVVGGAAYYPKC